MFHAQSTLVSPFVDMFKNIQVVDFPRSWFLAPGIIPDVECSDLFPGGIYIGNDIPLGDLLVVHVIDDLADRPVNGPADLVGLGYTGQE